MAKQERWGGAYLEGHGKSFVAAPVRWQNGAQKVGAVSAHELSGVVRQHVHHWARVRRMPRPQRTRRAHAARADRAAVTAAAKLPARERRGGRREPSGGGRVYRYMHHETVECKCHFRVRQKTIKGKK